MFLPAIVTNTISPNIADFNQQSSVDSFLKDFSKKQKKTQYFLKIFEFLVKCHKTFT